MASSKADTNSYIYRMGTTPNTKAAVSQKNKIYSYRAGHNGYHQIGVVSEFGHDESRSIEAIRGVGFGDMVAELVPGVTEPMSVTLNKTLLYTVNLFQVVGYKGGVEGLVRSLRHHRWPFDLRQELVFSEVSSDGSKENVQATQNATTQPSGAVYGSPVKALFTFYEGCWFESYSTSYSSDAAIVAENGAVKVTDVVDGVSVYGEYQDTGLSAYGGQGQFSSRFVGGSVRAPTGSFT